MKKKKKHICRTKPVTTCVFHTEDRLVLILISQGQGLLHQKTLHKTEHVFSSISHFLAQVKDLVFALGVHEGM